MKVEIPNHARDELTKLRCFLTGYHHGKGEGIIQQVPGETILLQLITAIDKAKPKKKEQQ